MELPVNYDKISSAKRKLVREEYARRQDGRCLYCSGLLTEQVSSLVKLIPINRKLFPRNFFQWPVHLHHDHKTGMTVGAVHAYCNAILWQHHGE